MFEYMLDHKSGNKQLIEEFTKEFGDGDKKRHTMDFIKSLIQWKVSPLSFLQMCVQF